MSFKVKVQSVVLVPGSLSPAPVAGDPPVSTKDQFRVSLMPLNENGLPMSGDANAGFTVMTDDADDYVVGSVYTLTLTKQRKQEPAKPAK